MGSSCLCLWLLVGGASASEVFRCDLFPPLSMVSYGVYQFGQAESSDIASSWDRRQRRTSIPDNTSDVQLCAAGFVCRPHTSLHELDSGVFVRSLRQGTHRQLRSPLLLQSLYSHAGTGNYSRSNGVCQKCPLNSLCRPGTTMPGLFEHNVFMHLVFLFRLYYGFQNSTTELVLYYAEGEMNWLLCPHGKVCSDNMASMVECPEGYFCPEGTSQRVFDRQPQ
jgi:hypothetical protein